MNRIAILTLYGNYNFWNKLQNYAVQEIIKKNIGNWEIITIKNHIKTNIKDLIKIWLDYLHNEYKKTWIYKTIYLFIKKSFNVIINTTKKIVLKNNKQEIKKELIIRNNNFIKFDEQIKTSKFTIDATKPRIELLESFDYYVVWSDQVRNPWECWIRQLFTLWYIKNNSKKIAFSASFWINSLPRWNKKRMNEISKFKAISVRETRGKEIIEEYTDRKDVQVLLDPTMLLPIENRDKVSKRPELFEESWFICNKYIFCYFLWNIEEKSKSEIERIAKEKNYKIIYIMNINDPFYTCWPAEFIWLVKNSYLICTDSFHWSVFSLLYNKPFVVFNRIDTWQKIWEKNSMNSRIITLLEKFKINDRYFNWRIDNKLLVPNYPQFEKILNEERIKADNFLKQAFSE